MLKFHPNTKQVLVLLLAFALALLSLLVPLDTRHETGMSGHTVTSSTNARS